ncbi:HNH endonuclease [Nocardioides sp. BYT-33-1]|uniref:HNH endonuclease n=1 Tax=Nocardioides sp. BYT-33-1 TaxID=3416952 RepID=UPI003F529209
MADPQHWKPTREQAQGWRKRYEQNIKGRPLGDFAEAFWSQVDRGSDDACWEWRGGVDRDGYGRFRNPLGRRAHRYSLALSLGEPLPKGAVVRHACDNPPCVNPAHLSIGTDRDNFVDMIRHNRQAWSLTHCPHGHLFDEANTYIRPSTGGRECRACWKRKRSNSKEAA